METSFWPHVAPIILACAALVASIATAWVQVASQMKRFDRKWNAHAEEVNTKMDAHKEVMEKVVEATNGMRDSLEKAARDDGFRAGKAECEAEREAKR